MPWVRVCFARWRSILGEGTTSSTFLLITTVTLFLLFMYRKAIAKLRKKRLRFHRKRDSSRERAVPALSEHTPVSSLLRYFELDRRVSELYDGIQFESMADYMDSLSLESGTLSIESILISILDRFGLTLALPLALLMPSRWKKSYDRNTVESKILPLPRRMIRAALSTKSLGAICEIVKELGYDSFVKGKEGDHEDGKRSLQEGSTLRAVELLLLGSNPKSDHGLSKEMSAGFRMNRSTLKKISRKILIGKEQGESQVPKEIHPAFVGLYFGNQGLKSLYSRDDESINAIVSCVCNRLVGNALLGTRLLDDDKTCEEFHVALQGNKKIKSLESFFQELESMGHSVSVTMRTNITSMGLGLSVACGTGEHIKYAQVPICYPLKTGLAMRKRNQSLEHSEVVTLMTHGACFVKISGPLLKNVELEWCLNITGMTGFQPVGGVSRPWQQDPLAFVSHNEDLFSSKEGRRKTFRLMTVISAVTNAVADIDNIVVGGYGFMGVCLDSVATLQHALTGTCSIYPLFLGGAAKMYALDGYAIFGKDNQEYAKESHALLHSLKQLPCDILVEPANVIDTAQRAIASLPQRSIFAVVESCKHDLQDALDFARRLQYE